ncbi:hypothetical protein V8C26DRAFT_43736 [Trichoderma gracile]
MGAGSRLRMAVMDLDIVRSECLEIAGRCRPLHALLLVTTILPGHAVDCRPCCCIFFDLYKYYIHTRMLSSIQRTLTLPLLRLPVGCCQTTPEVGSGAPGAPGATCQGQDISSNSPPAAALDTAKGNTPRKVPKLGRFMAPDSATWGVRGSLSLFNPSIDSCGALFTI